MLMNEIAKTPPPPYYAVIFSSHLKASPAGYEAMAQKMLTLAAEQPGFLGFESARETLGVTISYWQDLSSIKSWKAHMDHQIAQTLGKEQWYAAYAVRIAKVERDYFFEALA